MLPLILKKSLIRVVIRAIRAHFGARVVSFRCLGFDGDVISLHSCGVFTGQIATFTHIKPSCDKGCLRPSPRYIWHVCLSANPQASVGNGCGYSSGNTSDFEIPSYSHTYSMCFIYGVRAFIVLHPTMGRELNFLYLSLYELLGEFTLILYPRYCLSVLFNNSC